MIDWMLSRPYSANWGSPGLGKSVVTLKVIEERILCGSPGALLISPLRVSRITWKTQPTLWDHSSWLKVVNLNTEEGAKAWEDGSADIYLTHYDMLATVEKKINCPRCKGKGCSECENGKVLRKYPGHAEKFLKRKTVPVDQIVWDEISIAKDPSSKRINAVRAFNHHFKTRIGLTGTPSPNSYLDLFAQIRLLDGGERLGISFHAYRNRYFETDYMGYRWTLRPGAKEQIDAKLADIALVVKGSDWLMLPQTTTEEITVELPPVAKSAYKELEKEFLLKLKNGEIVASSSAVLVNKLLQITGGAVYDLDRTVHTLHRAKLDALIALRKRMGTEPMLVMTAFQHEKARVIAEIPGAQEFREADLPDWIAGKISVWVAGPGQITFGVDGLQKSCRVVVWMTPTYSQEKYEQTNARVIRTGQTRETLVFRIIAKGTIDDAVYEALRSKSDEQSGLMNAVLALQLLQEP